MGMRGLVMMEKGMEGHDGKVCEMEEQRCRKGAIGTVPSKLPLSPLVTNVTISM